MFSKDKGKRLKQVEYILAHNKNLTEKGRDTLERMKKALLKEGIKPDTKPVKKKEKVVNEYGIQKGDVFVSSWGYDATYHDFYEVTDVLGKKKVKVRELMTVPGEEKGYGSCDWTVRPVKNQYATDEEYIRNVKKVTDEKGKNGTYLKDKYQHNIAIYSADPFNKDWHEDNYH